MPSLFIDLAPVIDFYNQNYRAIPVEDHPEITNAQTVVRLALQFFHISRGKLLNGSLQPLAGLLLLFGKKFLGLFGIFYHTSNHLRLFSTPPGQRAVFISAGSHAGFSMSIARCIFRRFFFLIQLAI